MKKEDLGLWYVGFDQTIVDTKVPFQVVEVRAGDSSTASQNTRNTSDERHPWSQGRVWIVQTKDLKEVIEVETGFMDTNL